MPELPEVETARRGLAPHLVGKRITSVLVRQPQLRWPVPESLGQSLTGARIDRIDRRGKYLLLCTPRGRLMLHLGMSGSLRVQPKARALQKHDHLVFEFGAKSLRFHDPRRFGSAHWLEGNASHSLLDSLGPEPLGEAFTGAHLHARARGRKVAVKQFIMDAKVVVGVGNIYANEALFRAGIRPSRPAASLSKPRCEALAQAIKEVLREAIAAGGTTLQDFVKEDGAPGYFARSLAVYGKAAQPCPRCARPLRETRQAARTTTHCPHCQK